MTKIVQCPSCNTKFALNESQIAGIDDPKFQCSRCQTIFNLNEENPPEDEPSGVTQPAYRPISEKDNQTPDSPLHSEWNLGEENSILSNESEDENLLKDFSIDVSKFSLGANPQISQKTETSTSAQQLDFSFNQPIISHPESKDDSNFASDPEPTQKDSPTQRISRINPELLDTLVYGESGSDDSKINLSWDENEGTPKNKTSESDDLLGIFRSGSQRSTSGTYDRQTIISETDMISPTSDSSPSWSQLKEKMEKQDDEDNNYPVIQHLDSTTSESKFSDLASIDLMNSPFKDFNDPAESKNRSMKHTTVLQRDELEVEGFMRPTDNEEQETEHNYPNSDRSAIKLNPKSILKNLRGLTNIAKSIKFSKINLTPFTKSVILSWSVPGLFLILLFLWGQSLNNKNNLNQAESIFTNAVALFTPPELLIPPVNLVLNTLSAELRPDKSGDPMIVISGFIFNAGFQTVLNPTIEARTFDNGNTIVKSIKAPIPNELSRFASSLNLVEIEKEEILKLQNQRSWDGIAPSKSIPFKIVVPDIGPGYKFFSAKIYSVTEII